MIRSAKLVNKAFNGFLLASVLTVLGSQAGALIDALMLSHFIGADAMAGVNITKPVTQLIFSLTCIVAQGGAMLTGMAIGNQDKRQANGVFSTSFIVLLLMGLVGSMLPFICSDGLVHLLCNEPSLMVHTSNYLNVQLYGALPLILMLALMMYVAVDGAPKLVTKATIASEITHVVLGFIFLKFCGWGVVGAAWATNISYVVAVTLMLSHFREKESLKFSLGTFSTTSLGKLLLMGLPMGISTSLIAVRMLGANHAAMTYMGAHGMEAMAVCATLLSFSMIIISGTVNSFTPVATVLKGSDDNRGVALVSRHAMAFMAIGLGVYVALMVAFPGTFASIFGISNPEAMEIARVGIAIHAFNIFMQGFCILIPMYQIYSHKTLSLIVSIGQPLLPMAMFWLLCAHPCSISPWWGFLIGQVMVLLIIAPFILYKYLTDKSMIPFFLILRKNADHLFDVTIPASIGELDSTINDVQHYLTGECNIPNKDAVTVTVVIDELVQNAIKHGTASCIDLRVSVTGNQVKVMIHDDGRPFNPTLNPAPTNDSSQAIGLKIVQGLTHDLTYTYTFSQNVMSYTTTV